MPTIAIIGAGAGMGQAIARVFGAHGYSVALIARTPAKVQALADQLTADGIAAATFPADVRDHDALTAALDAARERFGSIDVLEYSPAAQAETMAGVRRAAEATPADIQREIDIQFYGAVVAAQAVLPAMREAGAGTIIVTTGAGSIDPSPMLGNITPAGAAVRNWALSLHKDLAGTGIQVAHAAIGVWIGQDSPDGTPAATPDQIAPMYWELHTNNDLTEKIYTA
ncbi:MAG: SDR family NAD(P)-dependent oxidoreductase [Actinomycetota bacterium]|nr:SDR family NAD(P)-dependent oxidoreductase [Actinomycetota bacterium]